MRGMWNKTCSIYQPYNISSSIVDMDAPEHLSMWIIQNSSRGYTEPYREYIIIPKTIKLVLYKDHKGEREYMMHVNKNFPSIGNNGCVFSIDIL